MRKKIQSLLASKNLVLKRNSLSENESSRFLMMVSALRMAMATFSSRVLGLVREQLLAFFFGASALSDAFFVAFRIPNLLRDLLAEGAFSSAFVPVFVETKLEGEKQARKLLWSLFVLLAMITGFLGLGMSFFAKELVALFTPSFPQDAHKFHATVRLVQIMSPYLLCVSLAALFMGVLNSARIFFIPAMAPTLFNLISILVMVFLPPFLTQWGYETVYSLGLGVLLGGIAQVLLQIPYIWKLRYYPLSPFPLLYRRTKKVLKLIGPGVFGLAATQINVLVSTILASNIVGAVSWLNYAYRLFQFPVGILSVSIAGSNLVHFSEAYKKEELSKAHQLLSSSIFFSWFVIIPCALLLYVLSPCMVHLIFERGRFSSLDSFNTMKLLQIYAWGLPFYGLSKIVIPIFYVIDKQNIPVMTSFLSVIFNICFCWIFIEWGGVSILVLGTTLTMFMNCLVYCWVIKKELRLPLTYFINKRLLKLIFAGAVTYWPLTWLATQIFHFSDSFWYKGCNLIFLVFIGILSYAGMVLVLGERELLARLWKK